MKKETRVTDIKITYLSLQYLNESESRKINKYNEAWENLYQIYIQTSLFEV